MQTRCCQCNKRKLGSHWIPWPGKSKRITHSYCPSCYEALRRACQRQSIILPEYSDAVSA